MYGFGGHGFGMGAAGWIGMIFIWVLVIAAAALVMKWLTEGRVFRRAEVPHHKTALTVLEERYARGQIDKKAYDDMRKRLQ